MTNLHKDSTQKKGRGSTKNTQRITKDDPTCGSTSASLCPPGSDEIRIYLWDAEPEHQQDIKNPGRLTVGSPTNHPFRKEHDLNQTSMRTCFSG